MRKASGVVAAMIMAIALYYTLFWGFDALRVLTSPTYGLEDVWRSQFVFGVGHMFNLSPMGLIKLAAFFGVMKLATAAVFAVHVADRLRGMVRGEANPEILEAGLIMVVLLSIAAVRRRCGRRTPIWFATRQSSCCWPALPPRWRSSSAPIASRLKRPRWRRTRKPPRRAPRPGSRPGGKNFPHLS